MQEKSTGVSDEHVSAECQHASDKTAKAQSGNPWLQKSMGKTRDESIKNEFLRYQAN
jgi:hypothetical protein